MDCIVELFNHIPTNSKYLQLSKNEWLLFSRILIFLYLGFTFKQTKTNIVITENLLV